MRAPLLCLAAAALACSPVAAAVPLVYPPPPSDATVDTYYGTVVADKYRPLESIDAPATRAWVEAESALSRSYLDAIPQRAAIAAHLTSIVNYERYGLPFHMRDRYFYTYNSGLQNQAVLYTMRGIEGAPRVLIDPNELSADGSVTIGGTSRCPRTLRLRRASVGAEHRLHQRLNGRCVDHQFAVPWG